jgi:hypothetical protein
MTTRKNRLGNFIIGLILGLLALTSSIVTFTGDVNIDLSKSRFVVGQVVYADGREIRKFGLRWPTFKRVFCFKLNNSEENFSIQRSSEGYEDLKSEIKIGDTLKVYYRSSLDDYNIHVFQVEKANRILEDYKNYKENASSQAGITLFIGVILTAGSILWFIKFNLLKFMTGWIES